MLRVVSYSRFQGVKGLRSMSVTKLPSSPCLAYPILFLPTKKLWEELALFCFCFYFPATTHFV